MKRTYYKLTVLAIISIILLVSSILICNILNIWVPLVVFIITTLGLIIALFIIYFKYVKFKCPTCNTIFKGNKREIFWAMHTPTKRKMTCPNCKEKKWCKDIFE